MKIELEHPYDRDWRFGYIQTNPENRKLVVLYNSHESRTSTSYARYLMSVHMGRYLYNDEHVDHIDDDKTNDSISNLQILTPEENKRKEELRHPIRMVVLACPMCGNIFSRRRGLTQVVPCFTGRVSCCSKECSKEFKKMNLDKEERHRVSSSQVVRCD